MGTLSWHSCGLRRENLEYDQMCPCSAYCFANSYASCNIQFKHHHFHKALSTTPYSFHLCTHFFKSVSPPDCEHLEEIDIWCWFLYPPPNHSVWYMAWQMLVNELIGKNMNVNLKGHRNRKMLKIELQTLKNMI